ncbi:MAG: di-heme oxidoredictase family protein [Terriglobia bacterium]
MKTIYGGKRTFPLYLGAILGAMVLGPAVVGVGNHGAWAQVLNDATPEVNTPFPGDPRLEPIPGEPLFLKNVLVFGQNRALKMRFPPRVNGQTQSDGDKHADLFVFFFADTGLPVEGQLPILEAVPRNAVPSVGDFTARLFSAIWELHAVTVTADYIPNEIDSLAGIFTSLKVVETFQTNIFLNCPIVPRGSAIPPGESPPIMETFFNGQIVEIVPYDIEDGGFNPQVMLKFVNVAGLTLPSPDEPHLVTARIPGDPFYTSIWEIWTVTVTDGLDVTTLKSRNAVLTTAQARGYTITSAGIRLNCPVVAIETAPGTGIFEPFPFEDAFAMLRNDCSSGVCRFNPVGFDFNIPASKFLKSRTFRVTEVAPGGEGLDGVDAEIASDGPSNTRKFPDVASFEKGNMIPLLLKNPFPLVAPAFPIEAGPNTGGEIIPVTTAALDAGRALVPPRLPEAIEANIAGFIALGLLDPSWAPGVRPYQERLALVGRALHELVWKPDNLPSGQGANTRDTTSCLACHSTPSAGAAARGLYILQRFQPDRPEFGPITDPLKPGSMFGSGAAEQFIKEAKARGEDVTFAHGSRGQIATIRRTVAGARNAHFGVQTTEIFGSGTDPDGDGIINESTVGEVTAETVFLMSNPVPRQAVTEEVLRVLGVTRASLARGKRLFRRAIGPDGIGCASCHTPFHPLMSTTFLLTNPESASVIPIELSHHIADQDDVNDGLAAYVGQPGIRTWGDFKLHLMGGPGDPMFSSGTALLKTAELWGVNSQLIFLRTGSAGSLEEAILAHRGEGQASRDAFAALYHSSKSDVINFLKAQLIQTKLGEGSGAVPEPELAPGDINGDGIIDRDDLFIILGGRNTHAIGSVDRRDLDGDGMITVIDARRLVLLCTNPRCAPG